MVDKNTAIAEDDKVKVTRNFRNIADIENFYRFVYENDLRREAKMILEGIVGVTKKKSKSTRKSKKRKLQ